MPRHLPGGSVAGSGIALRARNSAGRATWVSMQATQRLLVLLAHRHQLRAIRELGYMIGGLLVP